jgi:hypothetical protein
MSVSLGTYNTWQTGMYVGQNSSHSRISCPLFASSGYNNSKKTYSDPSCALLQIQLFVSSSLCKMHTVIAYGRFIAPKDCSKREPWNSSMKIPLNTQLRRTGWRNTHSTFNCNQMNEPHLESLLSLWHVACTDDFFKVSFVFLRKEAEHGPALQDKPSAQPAPWGDTSFWKHAGAVETTALALKTAILPHFFPR